MPERILELMDYFRECMLSAEEYTYEEIVLSGFLASYFLLLMGEENQKEQIKNLFMSYAPELLEDFEEYNDSFCSDSLLTEPQVYFVQYGPLSVQ